MYYNGFCHKRVVLHNVKVMTSAGSIIVIPPRAVSIMSWSKLPETDVFVFHLSQEAPSGSNTFPNLPDPSPKELPEAPMPHLEDPNTPTPVNAQRGSQTFPLADVPQTKGPPSAFTDSLAQTDLVGLATSAGGAQGPKKSGIKIVDVVKVIGPKAAGPVACEVGIGVSGTDAKALPEGRGAVPVAGSGAGSQLAGKQWGGEATSGVELLVEAAPLAEEDQIERPIENGEAAEGQQTGDERPHQREQPSARAEQRTALGGHASQRGMAPGEEQKSWGPPWLKALFEKGWEKECSKEHNTMIRALCIVCAELGSARPVCGACLGKEHDGHNMAQVSIPCG